MTPSDVDALKREMADLAKQRYTERTPERQQVCALIEKEGVLRAAGTYAAVRRVAHMTVPEGRMLSARRSLATGRVSEREFEAVLGRDDSDHINIMLRGQVAARAVCRLAIGSQAVGTGFLVAPGLLVTNNHVIGSPEDARRFVAEFDYELDLDDQPRVPIVRFSLEPDRVFVTSDRRELDFTFVAVRQKSLQGDRRIEEFGWIPLDDRVDKILTGEPAVIIQHPRGEQKRVCIFSAELVDKLEDHLHYTTDTDGGSSGSCVFNRSWQLVALHHAAVESDQLRHGQPRMVNEGIRVSSILRALQTGERVHPGVDGDRIDDREAVLRAVTDPAVIRDGRPQLGEAERPATIAADDRTSAPRVGPRTVLDEARGTVIRRKPADHFEGRSAEHFGYKSGFLRGHDIPMPALPDALDDDVTQTDQGESILRYTHYSVILSASRRMPIVTAVNIAGARSVRLGRKERDFEAADVWSYDPRVPEEAQLGPEIYDRTDFDYGHMVRREDPVWGDDNTARMANDDSFYMTNCAPQHNALNTKTWQALENAILDSARASRRNVSVFTGPVLSPDDPYVLDVQVPTAFWKVVAYLEAGELRAHGFMQWQTDMVSDMRVRPEAFADGLARAEQYQVPIRDIARITSLDFGPLLDADTFRPAGSQGRRRRLDESLIRELLPVAPRRDDRDAQDAANSVMAVLPSRAREVAPSSGSARDVVQAIRDLQATLARFLEHESANGKSSTESEGSSERIDDG